jgi:hypothetical protein
MCFHFPNAYYSFALHPKKLGIEDSVTPPEPGRARASLSISEESHHST